MTETAPAIGPEERGLAVCAHLSGLAGYVVPLGGVIVPIIIWMVKSEAAVIAGVAKQALLLNLIVFVLFVATFMLWITIILIPVVIMFWIAMALAALALPIVGAIKASQGDYYRYPVVGLPPG
ncbi:MAG: DUF4870 domain-containing protein [Vicinamibacterales bacterium]|jgi:hypothetical protein|nr:DUF4870 domain-containing protein [Vicinamibacterales bacterium]HJN42866.1 DUF4870 domain-containing protein [Vicinamibacterales bacterium]